MNNQMAVGQFAVRKKKPSTWWVWLLSGLAGVLTLLALWQMAILAGWLRAGFADDLSHPMLEATELRGWTLDSRNGVNSIHFGNLISYKFDATFSESARVEDGGTWEVTLLNANLVRPGNFGKVLFVAEDKTFFAFTGPEDPYQEEWYVIQDGPLQGQLLNRLRREKDGGVEYRLQTYDWACDGSKNSFPHDPAPLEVCRAAKQ